MAFVKSAYVELALCFLVKKAVTVDIALVDISLVDISVWKLNHTLAVSLVIGPVPGVDQQPVPNLRLALTLGIIFHETLDEATEAPLNVLFEIPLIEAMPVPVLDRQYEDALALNSC